jgi:hypothetical protein
VDGGYTNNIPISAFDLEEGTNPKTLGIRLSFDEKTTISTLADLLLRYPITFGFTGTGEAQLLNYEDKSKNQSTYIILDTTGLDLINFKPGKKDRDAAIDLAEKDTLEYFNASGK